MINVSGFLFEDEELAAQAKREEEGVRFIREKSALNNPEVVLKLYKTILQQKLFVTPVGLRFITELQDYLVASSEINNEDIPAIDTGDFMQVVEDEAEKAKKAKKEKKEKKAKNTENHPKDYYKSAFYVALFFAIVFGFSVLGMFAIAEISNNNVTILNYRNEIINQYEQWEKELESEEDRLKEWEEELSEREAALNDAGNGNE